MAGAKEEGKYITLKQAAALSHVAYAKLRRDIENGKLPAFRAGRKYFLDAEEVAAYARAAAVGRAAEGYTVRQVMQILPLSYAFLIEMIHDGRLQAVKRGRSYIIPRPALEAFLAASRNAAEND